VSSSAHGIKTTVDWIFTQEDYPTKIKRRFILFYFIFFQFPGLSIDDNQKNSDERVKKEKLIAAESVHRLLL
jgi:hypothetical protein